MFVGVGASRVRDTFATAKKSAPSILFIDEVDAIGRVRGAGIGGGHDEREQTLNQILVEMDGFDRDTKTIVIAATNRPDVLDPALLRPGRFDRRIVLDLPSINDREKILKIHTQDKSLAPLINLREIAERTPGFSGADLANLTNEAAILAARRNQKTITHKELLDSIEKVILGPERRSRVLTEKEKEITAYHEAGHALVSALLPNTAQVRKISIITRGRAAGYTMRMPAEEKYMKTRSEFLEDLCALLGGYVAEEIKFKEISTGAANDLKEATDIAMGIVTKYGMSKKIGPISFSKSEELIFFGREISSEREYSEETAAKIDKEVIGILKKCYNSTKGLLRRNIDKLEKVTKELIEKETLEKEEFEKLVK
jgi:cell division protease FtsH